MASATGTTLGAVLAVVQAPTPPLVRGSFSGSAGAGFSFLTLQTQITRPLAVCSISVKFRLGG
jgi:hypothetical protein